MDSKVKSNGLSEKEVKKIIRKIYGTQRPVLGEKQKPKTKEKN